MDVAKILDVYLSSPENLRQFIEISDPMLFAQTLTETLQNESKDFHFYVEYSSTPKITSGEHNGENIETESDANLYIRVSGLDLVTFENRPYLTTANNKTSNLLFILFNGFWRNSNMC